MAARNNQDDVLIIGGGHNGLVCAAYLAGAGLKVRVLERRGIVGGAAVTEEFHPGFRNSTASYTVSLLNPKVIRDLRLHEHGLRVVERPYANFLPLPDGRAFRLGGEQTAGRSRASGPRATPSACPITTRCSIASSHVLRELMVRTPPNVSDRLRARRLAGVARCRQAPEAPRHARPARPARPVHQVRGRTARRAISNPHRSRRCSAGIRSSAISPARTRRAGLRAAAPRVRRGQRQVRACGATRSAAWARSRRRSRRNARRAASSSKPMPAVERVLVERRQAPSACACRTAANCARRRSSPTSIRNCCTRS